MVHLGFLVEGPGVRGNRGIFTFVLLLLNRKTHYEMEVDRVLNEEGSSSQVVERFSKKGMKIESQPVFIDKQGLVKKSRLGGRKS